jgi:O-antigen/teichoic acid export membrane protein
VNNTQGRRLFRAGTEAGWVAAGQLAAFLGGFATIKILTSQLGPDAYGQLALGISIAGVLHMFLYGPIEQTALRFVSIYREREQLGLLFRVLGRFHVYAAILVGIALMCAVVASQLLTGTDWGFLILPALILGWTGGMNTTLASLQSAFRRRATVALFQVSDVWLRLLLACAGLAWFGISANIALLGFCLATSATAAAQMLWIWWNPPATVAQLQRHADDDEAERRAMVELAIYGRPYIAFAAFAWLSAYSDRWMILTFLDDRSVGIYAALFQIANAPIALIIGFSNLYLVPLIFDRAGAAGTNDQIRASARLLRLTVLIHLVMLIGIITLTAIFGEWIVRFITSEAFSQYASHLWLICLGISLSSIGQLLVVKGLAHGQTQQYILLPPLALTGVALSLCISGAGYLAAVIAANRRLGTPST